MSRFLLGIVGGMGPLAGVHFQKLIIEATPAAKDQEHLPVICFTNPQIPDRTASLAKDGGSSYVEEIVRSIKTLEGAGVTHIAIPCHTAHARIGDIKNGSSVPVFDLVDATLAEMRAQGRSKIGLLATTGTLKSSVYTSPERGRFEWVLPSQEEEQVLMQVIYGIKGGEGENVLPKLKDLVQDLTARGAEAVILGCTELSLYADDLLSMGLPAVDPLRILAREVVTTAAPREAL